MSVAKKQYKRVTVKSLVEMKANGEKISMLTAYDYPTAKQINDAGIDMILVGDSCAMVVHGHPNTLTATMDMMVLHSISQTAYLKLLDIMYKTSGRERTLSGRELEAINMIARGKSNPEVATAMSVSVNTINTLLKRIFEKLDVSDRVSAVMRAYALGYIA